MTPEERLYSYTQSSQIGSQTGNIGHLRADMGSNGEGFFSSWFDFRSDLKTEEFKEEFDDLINELRKESGPLSSRTALSKFCFSHSEAIDRTKVQFRKSDRNRSLKERLAYVRKNERELGVEKTL